LQNELRIEDLKIGKPVMDQIHDGNEKLLLCIPHMGMSSNRYYNTRYVVLSYMTATKRLLLNVRLTLL
jgi:hypothetical protein